MSGFLRGLIRTEDNGIPVDLEGGLESPQPSFYFSVCLYWKDFSLLYPPLPKVWILCSLAFYVAMARRAVLDAQARSSCDLSPGLSTISTGHHHQLVRFFMHHSSPPFGHKVHQCVAVPQITPIRQTDLRCPSLTSLALQIHTQPSTLRS